MRHRILVFILLVMAALQVPIRSASVLEKDSPDPSIWPNQTSRANSDEWLAEHHDSIRQMRPRLLVLNFSNQRTREVLEKKVQQLIDAIAESSRYHGYKDPKAPVFLQYEVFKFVDLRDEGSQEGNSTKVPKKKTGLPNAFNFSYDSLFDQEFARHYGVPDPQKPDAFLDLKQLVDRGYVHEVWFFTEATPDLRCYECVEEKPFYDEQFKKHPTRWVQAGNGGDAQQRWIGRSLRINNINPDRGIGCAMENLGHALEGTSRSKAIPYFTQYFREFAGMDLNEKYSLPFDSFYSVGYNKTDIDFPEPTTAVIQHQGKTFRITNYVAAGGNAHFPPNGRKHYDLVNDQPVSSTIEDWRIGSAGKGEDRAAPWTPQAFAQYKEVAPDCMGPWLVYWRQNMPGLNNRQKDKNGRPMKNWWPFLFY
jgi:hypothetical protein